MINIEENIPLGPYTTLGVGGCARFFVTVRSRAQLQEALCIATKQRIKVCVLGGGSNTLVSDGSFDGLVIRIKIPGITLRIDGDSVLARVGAGVTFDSLVRHVTERGLWGVENLAGIPGTVGAAPVQNIGAYGTELSDTFVYADGIALPNGNTERVDFSKAAFEYRESIFKKDFSFIITSVTLRLSQKQITQKTHPALEDARASGVLLDTPSHVAQAIRVIRSDNFMYEKDEGTAGSFFKNPIVSKERYTELKKSFPAIPGFSISSGVKIPLAWILDVVLHMRGFEVGAVRLYEHHPLILIARLPAEANDIEVFTKIISARVKKATGIIIEREVRTLASTPVHVPEK